MQHIKLEEIYRQKANAPSDINEHLPLLKEYASKSDNITEMGIRWITSTWALLCGYPKKLTCIDLESPTVFNNDIYTVENIAKEIGTEFKMIIGNTMLIDIEPTDFLFIDTTHEYKQLTIELAKHGNKCNKYIGFHDTISFGKPSKEDKGLLLAINEFLDAK